MMLLEIYLKSVKVSQGCLLIQNSFLLYAFIFIPDVLINTLKIKETSYNVFDV